jgi:hypothetical protein
LNARYDLSFLDSDKRIAAEVTLRDNICASACSLEQMKAQLIHMRFSEYVNADYTVLSLLIESSMTLIGFITEAHQHSAELREMNYCLKHVVDLSALGRTSGFNGDEDEMIEHEEIAYEFSAAHLENGLRYQLL